MAQKFRIATSSIVDSLFIIGKKSTVTEELFWQTVKAKVKEITAQQPKRYEEVLTSVTDHLKKGSITILDTWFEIKGRP